MYFLSLTHWPLGDATVHYSDVIMGTMASQITSLTNVYSTVYSGVYQRKHHNSASLAFAVTGEFPAHRASNAENVSTWWRHHVYQTSNFHTHIKVRYLGHFLWNYHQTRPRWWLVDIGSGNGLVPSGNKPLPEPMPAQISVATWCDLAALS